jgi:DNA-binding beta-propeller fold protein YncE
MKTKILYLFALMMAFAACEKEDTVPYNPPIPGSQGIFILNEGNWGGNDASLLYYNFETATTSSDLFEGKLGDTGQDMLAYGGKLYITVTGSNCIHVLNLNSFELLKTITNVQQPRYLATYGGKVYATAYGATPGEVLKIDTTSLSVEGKITVGANPEGIAAVNGKLYVANGGYGAGNTVSVVNTAPFQAETTITVPQNPYILKSDKNGMLYLSSQDVYNSATWELEKEGGLHVINPQTKAVTENILPATQRFNILDDVLYFYTYGNIGAYHIQTKTTTPIISDETVVANPYGIGVNPKTKEVYISDAEYGVPSNVLVFGSDGKLKNTIPAGVNANTFVFY